MEEQNLELYFNTLKPPLNLIKKYIKHKLGYKYIYYEKIIDYKKNSLYLNFINYRGNNIKTTQEILNQIINEIQIFKNDDFYLCYNKCFLLEQLRYKNYEVLSHPVLENFYYIKKNKKVFNYINKFKNLDICRTFLENKIVNKILYLKIVGLSKGTFENLFENNLKSVNNIHYICNDYDKINLRRIEKGLCPIFEYSDKFKLILALEKLNEKYNLPIFTNSYVKYILDNDLVELPFKYIFKDIINIIDNNLIINTVKFKDEKDAYTYFLQLYSENIKCILHKNIIYYTNTEKIIFDNTFKDTKLLNYLELNSKNKINFNSNKELINSFIDDDYLILGRDTSINSETKNPIKLKNYNPLISNGFNFTFDRKKFNISNCITFINLNTNTYIIKNKKNNEELIKLKIDKTLAPKFKKSVYKLENYGYFLNILGLSYYIESGVILDNTVVLPKFFNHIDIEGIIYLAENI